MALPYFYIHSANAESTQLALDENNSKHIIQVLRMKLGELILVTDGRGHIFTCKIIEDHRKKCVVFVLDTQKIPIPPKKVCIAISPLKNNSRFEWFIEKATEIGIMQIVPLLCERTEKVQVKTERLQSIMISAMLQSQQAWLPILERPIKFSDYLKVAPASQKLIAHCESDTAKTALSTLPPANDSLILVGPEGDFTNREIEEALQQNFKPVALGNTRLRTETAAIVAITLLQQL